MNTKLTLGLQGMRRTSAFLVEDRSIRSNVALIARQVIELNLVIDRFTDLANEQKACDREARDAVRKSRQRAKALLNEHVRPVMRLAEELFPTLSPIRPTLISSMGDPRTYVVTMAIAKVVARKVEPHQAKFVEAGCEPNFIVRIDNAVEGLRDAMLLRGECQVRRARVTAAMELEFSKGRRIMRVLDALVAPQLRGAETLAHWKAAARYAPERHAA